MPALTTDPGVDRQLPETPPWIFWRSEPAGNGREGPAVAVQCCGNPECPCAAAGPTGLLIDHRLRGLELDEHRFRTTWHRGAVPGGATSAASVQIDFETRDLCCGKAEGERGGVALEWLRGAVEGELFDLVFAGWVFAGWLRLRGAHPGEMAPFARARQGVAAHRVPWQQLFRGRPGAYESSGRWYAVDHYCPDRQCGSGEMEVQFMRRAGESGRLPLPADIRGRAGTVRVDVATGREPHRTVQGRVVGLEPAAPGEDGSRALGKALRSRYRDLAGLHARRQEMHLCGPRPRAAGSDRPDAGPGTGVRTVDPSDPCPCGSGRRLERCCATA